MAAIFRWERLEKQIRPGIWHQRNSRNVAGRKKRQFARHERARRARRKSPEAAGGVRRKSELELGFLDCGNPLDSRHYGLAKQSHLAQRQAFWGGVACVESGWLAGKRGIFQPL